MNDHSTPRKLSLPVVPVSFLALVIIGALLYGWLRPPGEGVAPRPEGTVGVASWTRTMNFPYAEYDEGEVSDFIGTHSCRFDPEGFC